jgi:anti-sigma B factor antagonist
MLKGFKAAKASGGELVLLRPSECVRQMLTMMKLDRLIRIAADESEARALLRVDGRAPQPRTQFEPISKRLVCRCAGELSLSVAESFAATLLTGWTQNPSAQHLQIDLAEVDFMDSSGLGCLVRARKLVNTRPGAQLQITGANENVRNVIQLAQMRELLGVA